MPTTDTDLANRVESFYSREAESLTPEERAVLANAVKLIRPPATHR